MCAESNARMEQAAAAILADGPPAGSTSFADADAMATEVGLTACAG